MTDRTTHTVTLTCKEGITEAKLEAPEEFDFLSWGEMLEMPVALTFAGHRRCFNTFEDCLRVLGDRGFDLDVLYWSGITGGVCSVSDCAGLSPSNRRRAWALAGLRW